VPDKFAVFGVVSGKDLPWGGVLYEKKLPVVKAGSF
jgi:hypothetical protein